MYTHTHTINEVSLTGQLHVIRKSDYIQTAYLDLPETFENDTNTSNAYQVYSG